MKRWALISALVAIVVASVFRIVYLNTDCKSQGGTLYRNLFGIYECVKVERVLQ